MSRFTKLSNDPHTGEPTINGQPASKQAVRDLLRQNGQWEGGEFITVDIGGTEVGLQPANAAAKTVVTAMRTKRGLFG